MAVIPRLKTVTVFHWHCGRMNNNKHLTCLNHTMTSTAHSATEGRLNEALPVLLTTHNPPRHSSAYLQLLRTCIAINALSQGTLIHSLVTDRGFIFGNLTFFQNNLLNMYVKCGSLVDARRVFENMTDRDVFSWNVIVAACQKHGCPHEALTLFHKMQETCVQANRFTFASILSACAKLGDFKEGMRIHQSLIESDISSDVAVVSALIDMYVKCGSVQKARELFYKMPYRNVVLWTTMIAGYAHNGCLEKALEVFKEMQMAGTKPNSTTFAIILPAFAKTEAMEEGIEVHQRIIEDGYLSDAVVVNALIDMYAKCGSIQKAHKLFDKMPQRDRVSWNTMIAGYAQNGLVKKALQTYKQMQLAGVNPDTTTFSSILPSCGKYRALKEGMGFHQSIMKSGLLSDVLVVSTLIDMYSKCGSIQKARKLFDKMHLRNVVSWTVMTAGYAESGFLDEALMLFREMPQRNVVSWTTVIAAYARDGLVKKALETFKQMQLSGVKPISTTFASVLPACAEMGALKEGMNIHQIMTESGFLSDVIVVNALIDMYAKCGSIHKARYIFDKMPQRDTVSWTAMISGYAMHGYGKDALKLFKQMEENGAYPDHVSFICVIFACSHAGLVDEGCKYFKGLTSSYCITPTMDHYVCMVDLLGRAGYLEEALNFIIKLPIKPVVVVWICLLGTCRSHKNIGLGEFTATLLFELDPKNAAPYVLLSDTYADVDRWADVQQEIYAKLENLSWEMKAAGYSSDSRRVLNEATYAFATIVRSWKVYLDCQKTIRVIKNLVVGVESVDCHTATKLISKIVAREIVVGDANWFHHYKQ